MTLSATPPSPAVPPPHGAVALPPPSGVTQASPHVHVTGVDPRAAGGRHAVRLYVRGLPADCPAPLTVRAQSRLRLALPQQTLHRDADGAWSVWVLEFSSRAIEHGQYPIALELRAGPPAMPARTWQGLLVLPLPRADAPLADIEQAFLTGGRLRVHARDGSIARVSAAGGGMPLAIDVTADDAGIAHLNLQADAQRATSALPTLCWDEPLTEVPPAGPAPHPFPTHAACLLDGRRQIRLLAGAHWLLGRHARDAPAGRVLLAPAPGMPAELGRRLSAQHALIRRGASGYEIVDLSRYGLLIDGARPAPGQPVPLREQMLIECTARIPGIACLRVESLQSNGVLLRRAEPGALEWFFLLDAGTPLPALGCAGLPPLGHRDGGFWYGAAGPSPLAPGAAPPGMRVTPTAYPEREAARGRGRRHDDAVAPAPAA